MNHNELIDTMLHTITVEREIARARLADMVLPRALGLEVIAVVRRGRNAGAHLEAAETRLKERFILSDLTGGQLDAVKQYIASFRLNS